MAVVLTVILAGFMSSGSLHAQTGALITSFNFTLNPNYTSTINGTAGTIVVPVYNSADITTLVATFTVSTGATVRVGGILQTSGVGSKDYTSGVTFAVTSGDLSTTTSYVVTVTRNPALTEKQLLSFSFEGVSGAVGVINQTDFTVLVTVPFSQSLANLVATFTSSPVSKVYIGAALQTTGVTGNDFTGSDLTPVIYKVVAENTSVRNYYVTVSKAPASSAKLLNSFSFETLNPPVTGVINQAAHTIALTVPHNTDVTALVAHFTHSPMATVKVGTEVQTSETTANDFTNPVTYTVVAENLDTQIYLVTVTKAPASNAKDITSFSFAALVPPVTGQIVNNTITLTVPYTTNRTNLVATFNKSPLSTVTVSAVVQVSGSTPNDFTTDKVYTVTAEDLTTKNYTVHVAVVPPLTGKSILTFSFSTLTPNAVGIINETAKTILLTVPFSTDVTDLVPTFTSSPLSTVMVDGVVQKSDTSAQNFTHPVIYTCTAQEGSSEVYTVTVTKQPASTANSILTFNFEVGFSPIVEGVINQTTKTITLTVPFSTDLSLPIKVTFTSSPLSEVTLAGVPQVSGVTENIFSLTTDKLYKCTAEDLSFEIYTVKVLRAPLAKGNRVLSFDFEVGFTPKITGVVSGNTIRLTVPYSTVLDTLIATFTVSPFATLTLGGIPQVSGVTKNNYSIPLEFKCIAEDGSFDYFTVTVIKAPVQTGKDITGFRFNSLTPNVIGVINQTTRTIAVSVPFFTDVTNLVATYTASPLAVVKKGSVVQVSGVTGNDYTNPVVFSVTAENALSQDYTVTVTKVPQSTAKDITDFRFVSVTIAPIIGIINQTTKTITLSVPFTANLTNLVATFTPSPLSTVRIGSVIQESGVTPNNFTNPLIYEVVAENGTVAHYTVTVTVVIMEKKFLTFSFASYALIQGDTVRFTANGTINDASHIIQVNIPNSAAKTSLAATFTVTPNTTVFVGSTVQVSGVTQNDFTSTRSFVLAATDGSTVEYLVSVTNNPIDTQKQILAFSFNGLNPVVQGVINETTKTINVLLPFGTNRNGLIATYTTTSNLTRVRVEGVIQKSGTTPNDFTNPLPYRCYDENGNFTEYTIVVAVTPGSPLKDITYFAFENLNPDVIGVINETTRTISAIIPNGLRRDTLKAFFTASPFSTVKVQGAIQHSGVTVNDFRIPIIYEVTAQDGSVKNYTVSVGESPDTTKPVVSNQVQTVTNLPGQFVIVRSNESTGKVFIIKENVSQSTIAQLEAAVAAGNGRSVYVTAANTDIAISTTNLPDGRYFAYAIDAAGNKSNRGTNVITVNDRIPPEVTVETQTKSNSLYNSVKVRSSEANSLVYIILEGVPQQSKSQLDAAVTAKKGARGLVNFADVDVELMVYGLQPGLYHAYAVDLSFYNNMSAASTNIITITEASRIKSILAFSFEELTPPAIGQIIGEDISVKVRVGTPVTALVATFTIYELSHAYVGLIEQVSGVTPNDFTNPVMYRVTAEDGTSLDYTVTVTFNTGIDDNEWLNSIKTYPNPVSDRLIIESTEILGRVQIINALGQTIEDIRNPGNTSMEIQTVSWMKGIYFVRYYRDEKFIGVEKLIKE